MKVKSLSPVRLLATPWTAAYRAPPSMGFAKQEYWSGLTLPFSESNAAVYKSITQHTEVYAPYGAYQGNAKMADFGELISITYQVNRITEKYHVIISVSAKNHLIKSSMYL